MNQPQLFPVRVSPVIPVGLAIIATTFTFLCWLVGERVYAAISSVVTPQLTEQTLPIANTLRAEWIAIPILITVCLWIWVALVVTKRQTVIVPG